MPSPTSEVPLLTFEDSIRSLYHKVGVKSSSSNIVNDDAVPILELDQNVIHILDILSIPHQNSSSAPFSSTIVTRNPKIISRNSAIEAVLNYYVHFAHSLVPLELDKLKQSISRCTYPFLVFQQILALMEMEFSLTVIQSKTVSVENTQSKFLSVQKMILLKELLEEFLSTNDKHIRYGLNRILRDLYTMCSTQSGLDLKILEQFVSLALALPDKLEKYFRTTLEAIVEFSRKEYFQALVHAIRMNALESSEQSGTSNESFMNMISVLVSRLIILGHSKDLVLEWCLDAHIERKWRLLMECMQEDAADVMLPCVLHVSDEFSGLDSAVKMLFECHPSAFRYGWFSVIYKGEILSDSSLQILVESLFHYTTARPAHASVSIEGFLKACKVWSDESHLRMTNIEMHRQITGFILLCMKISKSSNNLFVSQNTSMRSSQTYDPSSICLKCMLSGIQSHLLLSDERSRSFGMYVAEKFATWWSDFDSESLSFEISTDPRDSYLLHLVRPLPSLQNNELLSSQLEIMQIEEKSAEANSETDSLEPFDMSDEEIWSEKAESVSGSVKSELDISPDQNQLRKLISSVHSLPRLLHLLQRFGNADEELISSHGALLAALANIQSAAMPFHKAPGIEDYCPALVKTIMRLDCTRFPQRLEKQVGEYRKSTLIRLSELQPGPVGLMLIRLYVYREQSTLESRSEALTILAAAARGSSGQLTNRAHVEKDTQSDASSVVKLSDVTKESCGRVTKRLNRSLALQKEQQELVVGAGSPEENRFAPVAGVLFSSLLSGLMNASTSSNLYTRDAAILGQIVATMAVFVSTAGMLCLEFRTLLEQLLSICLSLKSHTDPMIRRSVAIAFGSIAEVIPTELLTLDHFESGGASALEWLDHACQNDPDEFVRKFALASAFQWSKKFSGI